MRFQAIWAVLAAIMVPQTALAQNAGGDWWGVLEPAPGVRLRLAVHIDAGPDGRLAGTLDSLDQNVTGLPITDMAVADGRLTFQLATPPAQFEGRWDAAAGVWRGEWRQGTQSWPLVLAAGQPPAAPPKPELPANWMLPADTQVAALIDARIATRPGEGIAVGLLDAGKSPRIVARGPATGPAFDGKTVFEIGSITKVFTAIILADMVSKGEVSLDDPAAKFLPAGATMPERGGRQITLLDLATHSSGLPRLPDNMPYENPADPYSDYSEKLLLDFLGRHQLTRDIGSEFEYSNLGFGLLGYLLGRAAGSDYPALLKQRITGPLRMRDTVIDVSPNQRARFAQGHDQYMRPASPWTLAVLAGAGAIRSTTADMVMFLSAAMDPKSPISSAMKIATTAQRPMGPAGAKIGLAWVIVEHAKQGRVILHDGGTGGFRAMIAAEPERGRGVVVLISSAVEPGAVDLAMHLLKGAPILPVAGVSPAPKANTRTETTLPSAELDRVVGRYQFSPSLFVDIAREGDRLRAQFSGQPSLPIYAEAPLNFFWRIADAQLRFSEGPDGKVDGVAHIEDGKTQNGKRVLP